LGLQIAAAIPVVSSMAGIYSGNNSSGAATVSSDNQKPDSQITNEKGIYGDL